MKFLNEKQIVEVIYKYINNSIYKYAILIDGKWGSGKTFFVKNKLIPELEGKNKKCIYISLNGSNKIEEISKQIYYELLISKTPDKAGWFKNKINSPKIKVAVSSVKIIGDVVSNFLHVEVKKDKLDEFYKTICSNIKDYTLIFDDLERCNINIVEVLGYINNFVEHDNMKVVIITNETEIAKRNLEKNVELRYLVTLRENNFLPKKKESEPDEFTAIEGLKARSKEIFDDDFSYSKIKEKTIGNTIYYRPNIDTILNNIINKSIKDEEIKKIIRKNIEYIKATIIERESYNFRTIQFTLEKFIDNYQSIQKNNIPKKYREKVLSDILRFSLVIAIDYKDNKEILKLKNNWNYTKFKINKENNLGYFIEKFSFILDQIMHSVFDEDVIKNTVSKYIIEIREKEKNSITKKDALNVLQKWYIMKDGEVKIVLNKVLNKLKNKEYDFSNYPSILMTVSNLVSIGFDPDKLKECLKHMKNNIKLSKSEKKIIFDSFGVGSSNQAALDLYNKSITTLEELTETIFTSNKMSELNKIFDNPLWGFQFKEYCEKYHDYFIDKKGFFKFLDTKKIILNIQKTDVENIVNFRFGIESAYSFSNLSDFYTLDIENLTLFLKKIVEIKTTKFDITKKHAIDVLIQKIESSKKLIERKKRDK